MFEDWIKPLPPCKVYICHGPGDMELVQDPTDEQWEAHCRRLLAYYDSKGINPGPHWDRFRSSESDST